MEIGCEASELAGINGKLSERLKFQRKNTTCLEESAFTTPSFCVIDTQYCQADP
jgi:hypothetical protein